MLSSTRDRLALPALLAAFVASRLWLYGQGVMVSLANLDRFWQFLPEELLKHDLARSLLYTHGQPPLFDLYLGLGLRCFGSHAAMGFQGAQWALGLALWLGLYGLLRQLRLGAWPATLLTAGFGLSPACMLYESWLFYATPVAAMLVLAAFALARSSATGRMRWLVGFFGLLAAVALTRSLYHLGWLVAIAGTLAYVAGPQRRRVLAAALPAVALVALWYAKNLVLVGSFGASTWMGLNVARVALDGCPPAVLASARASGRISEVGTIPAFSPLERYPPSYRQAPPTGVPALDLVTSAQGNQNFNHLAYVAIAKQAGRDSLHLTLANPRYYLKGVALAALTYLRPANDYGFVVENRVHIAAYDHAYTRWVLQQWPWVEALPAGAPGGLRLALGYLQGVSATQAVAFPLLVVLGLRRLRSEDPVSRQVLAFMLFNILWLTFFSTLLEVGENNRFRYDVDAFYLALFACMLRAPSASRT